MPRTIPAHLQTMLSGTVLTAAFCFTITRLDGVIFGLTTANFNLTFNGILYEALDSAAASTLRQSATTGVDNLDVAGVLSSTRISDQDLVAGRYDGALVEIFLVDYTQHPLTDRVLLVTGTIGEVTFSEGQYQAEFRSLSARLQQKLGALTSATCRVRQLFDSQCFVGGMNYAATHVPGDFRNASAPVLSVQSQQIVTFTDSSSGAGTGLYDYGRVQFNTGANAGLALEVKRSVLVGVNQMQLTFVIPWALTVLVGDTALLEQGCDRRFPTCTGKFGNGGNHRAEPYLPGNDRVSIRWGRR